MDGLLKKFYGLIQDITKVSKLKNNSKNKKRTGKKKKNIDDKVGMVASTRTEWRIIEVDDIPSIFLT